MTKTFEELEAKVAALAGKVREIENMLLGDAELEAKWEAGKINYPNIPKPPPGALVAINTTLESVTTGQDEWRKMIDAKIYAELSFARRLEAFFGPMLAGKNPPLDGDQVATRGYVDDALQRLATRLRDGFSAATTLAGELLSIYNVAPDIAERAGKLRHAIQWLITAETEREREAVARANRPSRVQSLVYALTGKNGARP